MTSPPERDTSAAAATGLMESLMNCTCPSAKTTLAPPVWKLKISSLGPQLLVTFQHPPGPSVPGLVLLLLTILKPVVVVFRSGSPETPKPLSCSAQRQNRRVAKGDP